MTSHLADPAPISVVVASHGRPEFLRRCLQALGQVLWPQVEIVVVADADGCRVASDAGVLKVISARSANIAAARNAGIAAAGGEIVAFIDDDAVPEPMWLAALAAAFADPRVGAVTGPVLGRNGISLQSGKTVILSDSSSHPAGADRPFAPGRFHAPKSVGTNMAFRAGLVREVGGFDETFRFYLDDSDLSMRLGLRGIETAYAPLAVVHHAYAASARRRADRAPRDLYDIGRSTAAFVARHRPDDPVSALDAARRREWHRAVAGLQSGLLEPRDLRRLMAGFDRGVAEGREDTCARLADFGPPDAFQPRPAAGHRHAVIAAATPNRARARAEALRQRNNGAIVSLFVFSPSTLFHHVRYGDGMWVQTGGVWGRSVRNGPILQRATRKSRLSAEIARVSDVRGLSRDAAAFLPNGTLGDIQLFQFT